MRERRKNGSKIGLESLMLTLFWCFQVKKNVSCGVPLYYLYIIFVPPPLKNFLARGWALDRAEIKQMFQLRCKVLIDSDENKTRLKNSTLFFLFYWYTKIVHRKIKKVASQTSSITSILMGSIVAWSESVFNGLV